MLTKEKITMFGTRVLSAILAGNMLFSSFSVYAADDPEVVHADVNFEDMVYSGLNEEDLDNILKPLDDLLNSTGKEEEVLNLIIAMEDFHNIYSADATLANIYTSLEAENTDYEDTYQMYSDSMTSISDKINITYNAIALSNYSDVLHCRVDDDDEWQNILDYVPLTDEQKRLDSLETELVMKYDDLYNKEYTASINGTLYTSDEMSDAYDNGDISYTEYIEGVADILTQENQERGELYIELVNVRKDIASSYGYDNYAYYAYDKLYGRTYTPDDLNDFRDSVKNYYSEVYTESLNALRSDYHDELMELYEEGSVNSDKCREIVYSYLDDISDSMVESFDYMTEHNLCDIDISDTKSPGAYTTMISGQYNAPYLFNCSSESYLDVSTLIHEFGHYNAMYHAPYDNWYYDDTNLDIAEIHSQGLEMLFDDYNQDIFGDYAEAISVYNVYAGANGIVQGCKEDAFQIAVFQEDGELTVERLNEIYYDICVEYGDEETYDSYFLGMYGMGGVPSKQIYEWVNIPHTFESPFYYISYAISMSAVSELMLTEEKDRDKAIEQYMYIIDNGLGGDFSEVLEKAGVNNPIENPRFDEYAKVAMVRCGLWADDTALGDDVPDSNSGDAVNRYNDDDDDDVVRSHRRRTTSSADSSDSMVKKLVENALYIATGVVAFMIFVAAIIIIVVVKKSKKKMQIQTSKPNQYVPQEQVNTSAWTGAQEQVDIWKQASQSEGNSDVQGLALPNNDNSRFAPPPSNGSSE